MVTNSHGLCWTCGERFCVHAATYTMWLHVHITPLATSLATIQDLWISFSAHGLPDVIVSTNGPNLVSAEIKDFLRGNGMEHVRTTLYHPSSNGLPERAVKTLKKSFSKQGKRPGNLEFRLTSLPLP